MEVRVEARGESRELSCVYCREPIAADRGAGCDACGVRFHRACQDGPARCPTLGCAGTITGAYLPGSSARPAGSRTATLVAALVVGALSVAGGLAWRAREESRRTAARQLLLRQEEERARLRLEEDARARAAARAAEEDAARARAAEEARRQELARRDAEAREVTRRLAERRAEEQRQVDAEVAARRRREEEARARQEAERLAAERQRTLEAEARTAVGSVLVALSLGDAPALEAAATAAARATLATLPDRAAPRLVNVRVVDATTAEAYVDSGDPARPRTLGAGLPDLRFHLSRAERGWRLDSVVRLRGQR